MNIVNPLNFEKKERRKASGKEVSYLDLVTPDFVDVEENFRNSTEEKKREMKNFPTAMSAQKKEILVESDKVKVVSKTNCEIYRKFKKVSSLNNLTGLEKKIASYMCRLALEERQLYEPRIEVENGFISKKLNINYESYKKIIQRLKKKNFIIASVRSKDRKRVIYFINSIVYADSLPQAN